MKIEGRRLALFKRAWPVWSLAEVCEVFDVKPSQAKKIAREHALGKWKVASKMRGEETKMPRWTQDEVQVLKKLYPCRSNEDIGVYLNRSVQAVTSKAAKMGLRKSAAYLRDVGRRNIMSRWEERR